MIKLFAITFVALTYGVLGIYLVQNYISNYFLVNNFKIDIKYD